jgi:hypothetical protein
MHGETVKFLGIFEKLRKATINFVMSVCMPVCLSVSPPGTTRLPLKGFSWNLVFEYFYKICRENSSFVKIWQEQWILCVKIYVHLWYCLAGFFREWELFQANLQRKPQNTVLCSTTSFRKSCCLWDKVEKYYRTEEATDDSMAYAHCTLDT